MTNVKGLLQELGVKVVRIPLTQGKFAIVDEDDAWVGKWKWCAIKHPQKHVNDTFYAGRNFARKGRARGFLLMHRVLLGLVEGEKISVDHINRDGLDNRKSNLRTCTQSQNMGNMVTNKGVSLFKGVDWFKRKEKFRGSIMKEGKRYHLGYFHSEEEAARAYNEKAIELFGEFARINDV